VAADRDNARASFRRRDSAARVALAPRSSSLKTTIGARERRLRMRIREFAHPAVRGMNRVILALAMRGGRSAPGSHRNRSEKKLQRKEGRRRSRDWKWVNFLILAGGSGTDP